MEPSNHGVEVEVDGHWAYCEETGTPARFGPNILLREISYSFVPDPSGEASGADIPKHSITLDYRTVDSVGFAPPNSASQWCWDLNE